MPFAGYADFDECVRKNRDKDDPKGYCATIQRRAEGGGGGGRRRGYMREAEQEEVVLSHRDRIAASVELKVGADPMRPHGD